MPGSAHLVFVLTLLAALGCGLVGGVFLVFSDFVMKALGHNPGQESWFSTGRD